MLKKSQSVPRKGKRDTWKRWCYGLIQQKTAFSDRQIQQKTAFSDRQIQQKTIFFVVMYNGCLAGNVLSSIGYR